LNSKCIGSVLSWALVLLFCGFGTILGMDDSARKTFLDQKKTVPPRREWVREVLSRKGGSFNFKVSSQGAIGVTIVTDKGYKVIIGGDKKSLNMVEDVLLTVDSKDGVFEGRVTVPAGSSHFIIENQTDNEVEIHLQCFIPPKKDLGQPDGSSTGIWPDPKINTRNSDKLQEYSPQGLRLSIELPGEPTVVEISSADTVTLDIKPGKAFAYNNEKISVFVVRFVSEKLSVGSSGLKDLAVGFLDGSAERLGASDVVKLAQLRDDSTIMLRSTFKVGVTFFETRGLAHMEGNSVWIIATRFVLADEPAAALSLQIINSVKFE
jgi:hypothetical protein